MNVEFHGDSTQVGASIYGGVVSTTSVRVSDFVARSHPSLTVKNYGRGGSTLRDALNTSIYPSGTFAQHIAQSDADVIVANWGINDAYSVNYPTAAYVADWQAVAGICAVACKKLIIQTPNPISVAHDALLSPLAAASAGVVCAGRIDIYTAIKRWYPQWEAHLSDGLHPNSIMYLYMGFLVAQSPAFLSAINHGT